MFNLAIPIQTKIKHFLTCPNISEPLQGWDFYVHPGILETQNLKTSQEIFDLIQQDFKILGQLLLGENVVKEKFRRNGIK